MTQPDENVKLDVPTTNDPMELTDLEKRELLYVDSAHNIADKILSYCGAFAGFEGFIINAYVGTDGPVTTASSLAYFFLFSSLFGNILAASLALLISGMIKNGVALGEYWWIQIAMKVITFTTLGSTFLYAMAFQLYVADSVIGKGYKVAIWCISCLLASGVFIMFYIVYNKSARATDLNCERTLRYYKSG